MSPSKNSTTLELDPADRAELHSLLEKLDEFHCMRLSSHQERINRALTHYIRYKGVEMDDDLDAMNFINRLMLCVARHGNLAGKIWRQIEQDLDDEDQEIRLQASARR